MRRKQPMTPAQQHRYTNLSFRNDAPANSLIVQYFIDCIQRNGKNEDGKAYVTAGQKCYAVTEYGFGNAIAGMFRAFRVWRRLH